MVIINHYVLLFCIIKNAFEYICSAMDEKQKINDSNLIIFLYNNLNHNNMFHCVYVRVCQDLRPKLYVWHDVVKTSDNTYVSLKC